MTLRKERAHDMAHMVVNLGISPSDYYALDGYERAALIAEHNRVNQKTN